ncbi:helix-turn-helix transcriptional regulator [Fimbriimonas ginsengisoli]|uniref:Putative transcriptional regulator n=1 Tax=Fimbriimonas ginsengisoli Gsoil 348 TaxID=661478 RepID=A0A068NUI8_FIMGI|nr:AraC family transcriptional regulator [Fimbriimonas ginsengisoli]AIE85284.1 putative transcriptional regulator [Fimbriimonas ginsengisoli Gsoil 348]
MIESFELIFVREGTLHLQELGRPFSVEPGQTLILFPNREHGGTAPYPPELAYYWIHFSVVSGQSGGNPLDIPQHHSIARPDNLVTLFHRFLEEQEAGTLGETAADLMLLQMLTEVVATPVAEDLPETAAAVLANRADAYIRTHFHEEISTTSVADRLGCSADYLGRAFRSVYGISIVDAIHRRRMHHARLLLMAGEQNIDEVSRACGFVDCGYFRRIFKRHEGMTPLRYQRLHVRAHVNTE